MLKAISQKAIYLALLPLFFLSISVLAQQSAEFNDVKAQSVSSEVWQEAKVNAAGGNYVNGVDVFYKRVTCDTKEQIIIKFVNNNSEDVLIEWADGVYTQDKQWVHNERNDKARELKLKAKQEIEGNCELKSEESLRVDVDQYVSDPEKNFKYAPSYIEVTK